MRPESTLRAISAFTFARQSRSKTDPYSCSYSTTVSVAHKRGRLRPHITTTTSPSSRSLRQRETSTSSLRSSSSKISNSTGSPFQADRSSATAPATTISQIYMVPRPLPYPSTHPTKGARGTHTAPGHFFATFPAQHQEILRRIYWKRRGYFMAVNIPALPQVEHVSSSVTRILGGNPSKFTLQGTNTYLLGRGRERILVDSGQGTDAWREQLYDVLEKGKLQVKTCVLTHWHHDHVMGVPDVRRVSPGVKVHKHLRNRYDPDQTLQDQDILDIDDGQRFSVGSEADGNLFEVEALHAPGHARDHMCLLITKSPDAEEVGCIFTADNVLGHGTAVFENLAQYVDSLKLMKRRVGENRRAFPGHGAVISDAKQKLDEYITHRQMREDEAMNVLCYGTTTAPGKAPLKTAEGFPQSLQPTELESGKELVLGKEWESMDMVKVIYRMYPESLWGPAEGGLLQVLNKLLGDEKVEKTSSGKWKASEAVMKDAIAEEGANRSSSPSKL